MCKIVDYINFSLVGRIEMINSSGNSLPKLNARTKDYTYIAVHGAGV